MLPHRRRLLALLASLVMVPPTIAIASPSINSTPGTTSVPATTPQNVCAGRLLLDKGHIDIAAELQQGTLTSYLKDDTLLHHHGLVKRSLDDVIIGVHDNAQQVRTGGFTRPELSFLGAPGSTFYYLPQTQKQDIIWPGYNTEHVDYSQLQPGSTVRLNLQPTSTPAGANWGLFLADGFGGLTMLIDSSRGDNTIDAKFAAHTHTNWVFSTPGRYEFDVTYAATLADGTVISTTPQHLVMAIGDQALSDCLHPTPTSTTTSTTSTTTSTTSAASTTTSAALTTSAAPTTSAASPTPTPTVTPAIPTSSATSTTSAALTTSAAPSTSVAPSASATSRPSLSPADKQSSEQTQTTVWAIVIPLLVLGIGGGLLGTVLDYLAVHNPALHAQFAHLLGR